MMKKILYISAITSLLALGACVSNETQVPVERGQLFNKTWHLVSMDKTRREDMPKYQRFTLTVNKNQLSGQAFNSFKVDANVFSNGGMRVGRNLSATRMLPMGRERVLEKMYFANILSAQKWDKVNGQLILSTGQGKLIFRQ